MRPDLWEPAALFLGLGAALLFQWLTSRAPAVALGERAREAGAFALALGVSSGVRHLFPTSDAGPIRPGMLFVGFVAVDFVFYWLHRFSHGVLWKMHANHHAPAHFDVGIAFRDSGLHLAIFAALFWGLQSVLGLRLAETTLLSAALIVIQWWTHTRTWVRFGALDWLVVSPRHHYVHHAAAKPTRLVNLGTFFCAWDQVFGTYQHPPRASPLEKPFPPRRAELTWKVWLGV